MRSGKIFMRNCDCKPQSIFLYIPHVIYYFLAYISSTFGTLLFIDLYIFFPDNFTKVFDFFCINI